jgi:hypothetical protein
VHHLDDELLVTGSSDRHAVHGTWFKLLQRRAAEQATIVASRPAQYPPHTPAWTGMAWRDRSPGGVHSDWDARQRLRNGNQVAKVSLQRDQADLWHLHEMPHPPGRQRMHQRHRARAPATATGGVFDDAAGAGAATGETDGRQFTLVGTAAPPPPREANTETHRTQSKPNTATSVSAGPLPEERISDTRRPILLDIPSFSYFRQKTVPTKPLTATNPQSAAFDAFA